MWFGVYFMGVWLHFKLSLFIAYPPPIYITSGVSWPVSGLSLVVSLISLARCLSPFCCPSGTVWVLNCKSLWVKDVNRIDFQTEETAKSVWLSLKGRDWSCLWVWVCAQAVPQHRVGHMLHQTQRTPGRHYNPAAPLQATGPPLFTPFSGGGKFISVLDFRRRTAPPLFCGWPGASSRLPDPPPTPLERNKHV